MASCLHMFMSRIATEHNKDLLHNQVCWVPLDYKYIAAYWLWFHLYPTLNSLEMRLIVPI